jgi:GT2 family glycosyltransferase
MNNILNELVHPICFESPRRVSGLSAWVEHIPFALNLVAALRPSSIVELGTHAGDSYLAFCQAVDRLGLGTRCHAVDTWTGDSHSGLYGPEVLAELRAHHDGRYGGFSRLVQSTFDDAVHYFPDGTIDLLHIDGLHTEEAVRHDFETWRPKLSRRAVVLLHDTNVREREFGVWRFWRELADEHPHFEFLHGHGLGLAAPGEIPDGLRALLAAKDEEAGPIRSFFFALGHRISVAAERDALVAERGALAAERDVLREEGRRAASAADAARAESARLAGALHGAEENARAAWSQRDELRAALTEREREATTLRTRVEQLEATSRQRDALEAALQERERECANLQTRIEQLETMSRQQRDEIARMAKTAVWRAGQRYWETRDRLLKQGAAPRRVLDALTGPVKSLLGVSGGGVAAEPRGPLARAAPLDPYERWVALHTPSEQDLAAMRRAVEWLPRRPLISVLTPVYDIDEKWLRRCIDSVRAQVYPDWELCLVDDASPSPHVARVLAEYAAADPRIRFERSPKNEGIVGASARALAMCRGEFVALLDHDDELSPDALYEVARKLGEHADVDLVYSDEDKLDPTGRRFNPFFKPDWSPELLMAMNYICHLGVYRRSLLEEVGGFRQGYDGSQDYDLVLRVTERARRVVHIPKVLYHWRVVPSSAAGSTEAKPYAYVAGQRALEDALARRSAEGRVEMVHPGIYRTSYAIVDSPLVSIVIPTKDKVDLLRNCIESIRSKSTYGNYEIIVVDNNSQERATHDYFRELGDHATVLPYPERFNWSAINNFAARHARGEYLLFMNNDMEVVEPAWIEAMLQHAQRPGVGAVGAKLLFPDDSIQHAGVLVGVCGTANHAFRRLPATHLGYFGFAQVTRNCAAVTGACMMVKRSVFEAIQGFDEALRVAFNDVDFCLRLGAAGYRVVYAPHATLYHFESATRRAEHPLEDENLMRERWYAVIANDPFHNPNLSVDHDDFRVAE